MKSTLGKPDAAKNKCSLLKSRVAPVFLYTVQKMRQKTKKILIR